METQSDIFHIGLLLPDAPAFDRTGLLLLAVVLIAVSLLATYLARKKGYSGSILIWAWLPLVNIYGLLMIAGLPDLALRAKIESLTAKTASPGVSASARQPAEE